MIFFTDRAQECVVRTSRQVDGKIPTRHGQPRQGGSHPEELDRRAALAMTVRNHVMANEQSEVRPSRKF